MNSTDGEQRRQELQQVVNLLGRYEQEDPGILIDEAIDIVDKQFPQDSYSITNIFNILEASILALKEERIDEKQLATALTCSLAIMSRSEQVNGPHLLLWSKYLFNSLRFNGLALQCNNLSSEDYAFVSKESKKTAAEAGWDEMKALRSIYEYFYNGGWFYYSENERYYPKPIGSHQLGHYQLVTQHSLLSFPHTFTQKELYDLLLGEVEELRQELFKEDVRPVNTAFEAVDVFIYLTHIASKRGLSISQLIEAGSIE